MEVAPLVPEQFSGFRRYRRGAHTCPCRTGASYWGPAPGGVQPFAVFPCVLSRRFSLWTGTHSKLRGAYHRIPKQSHARCTPRGPLRCGWGWSQYRTKRQF